MIIGVLAILGLVAGYYSYAAWLERGRCLKAEEKVVYEVLENTRPGRVRISVVDTVASTTVWSRNIVHPAPRSYRSFQASRCHFYIHQAFNYDYKNETTAPNFSFHIWRFPLFYNGTGKSLILTSENETGEKGKRKSHYGRMFSIDPSENYISLERNSIDKPDYALVIKNIKTGKDEYLLTLADLLKKYPTAAGSFDVGEWRTKPDGTIVLAGHLYQDMYKPAFYLLEAGSWKMRVWLTPEDFSGYGEYAMPQYSPYLAYTDFDVFGGIDVIEGQVFADKVARGDREHLMVADLETGTKKTIAEIPLVRSYRFNLRWVSEHELEYTLPDGSAKVYEIQ